MSQAAALGFAFAVGVALGAAYFGALWLVVRRLPRVGSPALWLGGTGILRLAAVVTLLYAFRNARWEWMVSALIGFLSVRLLMTRRLAGPVRAPASGGRARPTTGD